MISTQLYIIIHFSLYIQPTLGEWVLGSNGRVYFYSNLGHDDRTYEQAKLWCSRRDAAIVSVNDEAENNVLISNGNRGVFWIGLPCNDASSCDVRYMHWEDGHEVTFQNRIENVPSGRAVVIDTLDGRWRNANLNSQRLFLCEKADPCATAPCANGGTCRTDTTFEGDRTCTCPPMFTGANCEVDVDECASDAALCQHNISGTCVNTVGWYSCSCYEGYTGPECDVDIDECLSYPCVHGICRNTHGEFVCECAIGYEGEICDWQIVTEPVQHTAAPAAEDTSDESELKPEFIVGALVMLILTFLISAVAFKCWKGRYREQLNKETTISKISMDQLSMTGSAFSMKGGSAMSMTGSAMSMTGSAYPMAGSAYPMAQY